MPSMSPKEWSEKEIGRQTIDLQDDQPIEIISDQPVNIQLKKDGLNLFCTHKNTKEQNGYIICTKCGAKWKKNNLAGTITKKEKIKRRFRKINK